MRRKTAPVGFTIRPRLAGPGLRRVAALVSVLLAALWPLFSQDMSAPGGGRTGDPLSLVGMRLGDLIGRFGPPEAVYPVRGNEEWQDDVVFVYADAHFYIAKDRVWQIGLKSAYGVSLGAPKPAALLALGTEVQDQGDYLLLPLSGGWAGAGWPLTLRVNFNGAGMATAIFIYRPGF